MVVCKDVPVCVNDDAGTHPSLFILAGRVKGSELIAEEIPKKGIIHERHVHAPTVYGGGGCDINHRWLDGGGDFSGCIVDACQQIDRILRNFCFCCIAIIKNIEIGRNGQADDQADEDQQASENDPIFSFHGLPPWESSVMIYDS